MEQGNDEVQETSTDSAQELEKGKDVGVATEQLPQDETIITAVAATEVSRDAEEVDIVEEPQQADLGQPSRVETAEPADACTDTSQPGATHPLSLSWCFGFNPSLPVHNVSEGNRKMIFYTCSHTGVLYDCTANKQCLLQGHGNPITSTAVSSDRRWLVTADVGKDCMLIVWDSYSNIPVRTYFEGLGNGCIAVAMSHDARYVATLSVGVPQVVAVWDWTAASEEPLCTVTLSTDLGQQTYLVFHPSDPTQLASNSEDQVVFYLQRGSELKMHTPIASDKDFNKPVGLFSQSLFIPGSSRALTGTSEGCGLVWEEAKPPTEGKSQREPHIRKPLKLMKMHDSPITVATTAENLVVTGDSAGCVKFFDVDLQLMNWYDSAANYGPLASISFAHLPKLSSLRKEVTAEMTGEAHHYPAESTMRAQPFVTPDFALSTTTATIAHVTTNGSTTDVVFRAHDAAVVALAVHPSQPWLLTAGYSCNTKLWDYEKKEVLAVRDFGEPNYIQCTAFDPKGCFIGVGFTSGAVAVLDAHTLEDVCQPFRYARDCVTHIAFSHDSQYMATADFDLCVTVFVAQPDESQPWQFLAKHRAHYKQIEGLMFGVVLDSDTPRLLSVGQDRYLVEYDLSQSSEDDLRLLSQDRIEQSAVPLAMAWYPPLTKESFIMVASDQYKLKLYNSTTKMCRRTVLGPTFGSPIRKLVVLPAPVIRADSGDEKRRYLAYVTTDKVGLLLLPHDGNPHNSMCLVAHPGLVAELACSHDGRYLFTAGGEDCTVNMWSTNTEALEAASLLGGKELVPFYSMLEGGRDGEFFHELEDFFYYAQIRSQGPSTMAAREVSSTVPIEQVPYIMRAIGFYPSEQEIEEMLNEVKFSKYVDTGTYVTSIDLGDFIKLYVNHRPAFGLSPAQLSQAFRVLGQRHKGGQEWVVDKGELLTMLQEKGEHITEPELEEYLMTLLGCSDNPEVEGSFTQSPEVALQDLPDKISAAHFAEELLGLSTQ